MVFNFGLVKFIYCVTGLVVERHGSIKGAICSKTNKGLAMFDSMERKELQNRFVERYDEHRDKAGDSDPRPVSSDEFRFALKAILDLMVERDSKMYSHLLNENENLKKRVYELEKMSNEVEWLQVKERRLKIRVQALENRVDSLGLR